MTAHLIPPTLSSRKFSAILLRATASQFLTAEESRTWTTIGERTAEDALVSKSEESITIRFAISSVADAEKKDDLFRRSRPVAFHFQQAPFDRISLEECLKSWIHR